MRIDLDALFASYNSLHAQRASDSSARHRSHARRVDYDFLALTTLRRDVERLVAMTHGPGVALDLGSGTSPYRDVVERVGLELKTLDIGPEAQPDYLGTAEETGLDAASFDLVICTQVIEHVGNPGAAVKEIARILRPGGYLIITAPHVWFFHPHPHDYWRFTQEGMVRLLESAQIKPVVLLGQGGSLVSFCQVVNFLTYGVVGKLGAPLYATMNTIAALDAVFENDLFCLNFACLGRRNDC
jgi:SAM-dependent methyltransferase